MKYSGIKGITGRMVAGAKLSVGKKLQQRGFPKEKDRFHILMPRAGHGGFRDVHPAFGWFNGAAPEKRRVVYGAFVGGSWDDGSLHHYNMTDVRRLSNLPRQPRGRSWCMGNGVSATRYHGEKGSDDFRTIRCMGERCQFRNMPGKPCKAQTLIYFRPVWPKVVLEAATPPPPLLFRFDSGSVITMSTFQGVIDEMDKAAKSLGLDQYTPSGLPLVFTMCEGTNPREEDAVQLRFGIARRRPDRLDHRNDGASAAPSTTRPSRPRRSGKRWRMAWLR